jgi:LacI family transcriptional regulator
VFQAAEELGVRIPEDLSVVGFDNISEAKYLGLTTVDQNLSEMGYIATQMLIKLVSDQLIEVEVHKVPTKLVKRSSCRGLTGSVQITRPYIESAV